MAVPFERSEVLRGRARGPEAERDFEEFFDRTWTRALRMVMRMGLSREDGEDVVLDAMTVVYDRWPRVRPLAYREGWMLKVAANKALRQLKKASRRRDPGSGVVSPPEDEITTRISLRRGIAELPRRQREVIALRYLADMSEDQVAQVLGLNLGSVKQHASRGRESLRDILDDIQDGSGDRAC